MRNGPFPGKECSVSRVLVIIRSVASLFLVAAIITAYLGTPRDWEELQFWILALIAVNLPTRSDA